MYVNNIETLYRTHSPKKCVSVNNQLGVNSVFKFKRVYYMDHKTNSWPTYMLYTNFLWLSRGCTGDLGAYT